MKIQLARALSLGFLACSAAFAQSAASRLEFDVATVKPAPMPVGNRIRIGMAGGPGRSGCADAGREPAVRGNPAARDPGLFPQHPLLKGRACFPVKQ